MNVVSEYCQGYHLGFSASKVSSNVTKYGSSVFDAGTAANSMSWLGARCMTDSVAMLTASGTVGAFMLSFVLPNAEFKQKW
jgi:hypothetical protein